MEVTNMKYVMCDSFQSPKTCLHNTSSEVASLQASKIKEREFATVVKGEGVGKEE